MIHLSLFLKQILMRYIAIALLVLLTSVCTDLLAQTKIDSSLLSQLDEQVQLLMKKGDIPGLSLVIVEGDSTMIKGYGYQEHNGVQAVEATTLFELASCSKAFTGLAILKLQYDSLIQVEDQVSQYLPEFSMTYKGVPQPITIKDLLHHTSGIATEALSLVPVASGEKALNQTIAAINGLELEFQPGERFEYSSLNYDILGLIIERRSGISFESYAQREILGPLQMKASYFQDGRQTAALAQGHKISFFAARPYDPPLYQGNNPAGYMVSNAEEVAKWLQFQLGILSTGTPLDSLAQVAQVADLSIPSDRSSFSAYSAGWTLSLGGDGRVYHDGLNPSFSAFVGFFPNQKRGIALLANANSEATTALASRINALLNGEELEDPGNFNSMDRMFSMLTWIMAVVLLAIFAFITYKCYALLRGNARFNFNLIGLLRHGILAVITLSPLALGIYLFPKAMAGFSWEAALVWAPDSFKWMTGSLLAVLALSGLAYLINGLIQNEKKYIDAVPPLIALGFVSGLANTGLILIITMAIGVESSKLLYFLFYFFLVFGIYILGRKVVQIRLTRITIGLIIDLRIKLVEKILSTSYDKFEKIENGRVYTTLNDDTRSLGNAARLAIQLITSLMTIIGVFAYMMFLSFYTSVITILVIIAIAVLYNAVGKRNQPLFEMVRDTDNAYLSQINGMINGFKELSIHLVKRLGYQRDLTKTIEIFRDKYLSAQVSFINAFLVGESMLLIVLGTVAFAFPFLFPKVGASTLLLYIVVMLYLINPINTVLNAIPSLMQLRISWRRVQDFLRDIPANIDLAKAAEQRLPKPMHLEIKDLTYLYPENGGDRRFRLGPINLELNRGEALFIVGGNGSGKTTLCKVLTSLYHPESGEIRVNGEQVPPARMGEFFSTVFNPIHLFEKLYGIDTEENKDQITSYLETLRLSEKVSIEDGKYSTTNLSQGQRKRLALLQCLLEDRPVFLFDEWTADQDPEYRRFFYHTIIPKMKAEGKMIIAITHDDQFFDLADKVLKLDMGRQKSFLVLEKESV